MSTLKQWDHDQHLQADVGAKTSVTGRNKTALFKPLAGDCLTLNGACIFALQRLTFVKCQSYMLRGFGA